MNYQRNTVRVAAAQAAPIFLNREKTVEKACDLMNTASNNGARLIAFPEAFIPGYPDWVWLLANNMSQELDDLYVQLVRNAISIGDESTKLLCEAAKEYNITVAIGINEINTESSGASLFNSVLFISDDGRTLGVHRKLIPTGGERLVWARGDGNSLHTFVTSAGKIGGLICWENYMPMARQSMYNDGAQILVAPTWDKSEDWLLSLRHIAREGGMYVIGCCMSMRIEDIPETIAFRNLYPKEKEWINTGNSCIVNPKGEIIAGPLAKKEDILYADIDLNDIIAAKRMFDVAGNYSRPDVFMFSVQRNPDNKP